MAHKRIRARYRNCDRIPYKKGGRDNKDYFNTRGGNMCYTRNTIRIPSLNANNKTWNNFYKLFPRLKRYLMGDKTALYGKFRETEYDENNNVLIVREECYVGDPFNPKFGRFYVKTHKFKKTW